MSKLVLEIVMTQHKEGSNRLSVVLVLLIECIVKKVVKTPESIAEIAKDVIEEAKFIVPKATLVKLEQN